MARTYPSTMIMAMFVVFFFAIIADAGTVSEVWPVEGGDDNVAAACAGLGGWFAVGDAYEDNIEIRNSKKELIKTIDSSEIEAMLPWFDLGGGPDGPDALAWSDSGRLLFIMVHDDTSPRGTAATDGILVYNTFTDELSLFAQLDLYNYGGAFPLLSAVHFEGKLYAGTYQNGIQIYQAECDDAAGQWVGSISAPSGNFIRGLCVDRQGRNLFFATETGIYRAGLDDNPMEPTLLTSMTDIRGITWSDNYGRPGPGLFILQSSGTVSRTAPESARGEEDFSSTSYWTASATVYDIAASADGRLLVSASENGYCLYEEETERLAFEDWMEDEFLELVEFCKALIAPDGIPNGWVIDADVDKDLGWDRFHPASPDGAAWVILVLILEDYLYEDPEAEILVEEILERYSGLSSDGIHPERTADGIYRHWYDPDTGIVKSGWDEEWATMSTMKILLAASRAKNFYDDNSAVQRAFEQILLSIENWDDYIQSGTDAMYLKALATGGPDPNSAAGAFHEGIWFIEQAAMYGGEKSRQAYANWKNRDLWPTAHCDCPWCGEVTGNVTDEYLPAFVSVYPFLISEDFRSDPDWQEHCWNLLCHTAGWNDDNGPAYATIFSAGTTDPDLCSATGYNADSLSDHPCDVASFPALIGLTGWPSEHVYRKHALAFLTGAYHAYRLGARQSFKGTSVLDPEILYRRPQDDSWQPNSAGLPDVAMGSLGLGELLSPGSIDAVLAIEYPVYAFWYGITEDWNAPANWNTGIVPDDGTNVVIGIPVENGYPAKVTSDGNFQAQSIILESGGTLTISREKLTLL